ncbi:hypothetical protein D9M68_790170 [compost metagenome]
MGAFVPVVHAIEHGIALVDHQHRAFSQDIELGVGNDDRNFDDAVGVRLQAGHFHVQPDQVVFALDGFGGGVGGHRDC